MTDKGYNKKSLFKSQLLGIIIKFLDYLTNIYSFQFLIGMKRILLGLKCDVVLVAEEKGNWVTKWIAKYISQYINKTGNFDAELASTRLAYNKIIHFNSINSYLSSRKKSKINKSNKIILTWYHFRRKDENSKLITFMKQEIDLILTPSIRTKTKLIEFGFNEENIRIVPLAIDINHFKTVDPKNKEELKKKYKLPKDKLIIGSFQKDGVGWGEGFKPKLIKGPDIFCEVVKRLNQVFDIHVFLTGPSRGYVKKQLDEYKIPFTHVYFDDYLDIVECYNVLDLYLVTSRIEGGPMALLECLATGVPIITTNVGMASYIIRNGENGFISPIEDINQLFQFSKKVMEDRQLREKMINNGLKVIKEYSWENITKNYYLKIYKEFL